MFTKIKQALFKHKLFLTKIAVFFGLYFLMTDFSFASAQNDVDFKKIEDGFIQITTWISTIISVLLGALTYLVTLFLTPEWTSGTVFGLSKNLKDIWVLMSNIVYFAFAFILIAIAFANIVGTQGDFALKQALPRFIVGILIVPFSWFIVQFFVSLSSILTISALNLPFEVFQDYESQMSKVDIPKNCTLNLGVLGEQEGTDSSKKTPSNQIYSCGTEKISVAKLLKSDKAADGIFGIVGLYTYGLVNIEGISKIDEKQLRDQIKTIGDIVVKVVFDLLFIVVYAILMIALGLALMIRGIRLWIFMMLAPLFGIMYFFKKGGGGNGFLQKFNFKEFIALTLTPVYAMLALSFGIFFIFVSGKGMTGVTTDLTVKDKEVKIGDFTLTVEGAVSNDLSVTDFLKTIGDGALGVIGALILKIFGIVVLWGAVMAALKQSQITQEIIMPISRFGESVGELATKIPQFTPILPGGQTLDSLQQLPNKALGALQGYSSVKADDLAGKFGLNNSQNSQAINELNRTLIEMKGNEKNQSFRQNAISKLLNQIKTNNELLTDPKYREKATEVFKASGFDRIKADNIKNVENLSKILVSADGFSQSDVTRGFYRNIVGKDSINENDLIDFLKSSNSVIPESSGSNQSDSQSAININVENKDINLPNVNGQGNKKLELNGDGQAIANSIKTHFGSNENIIRANLSVIESQLNKVGLSEREVAEIKRLLGISNN
ncbi:hypothetical protein BLD25_03965 [Candidatus Gracilibacteria bacterium GN02-872]|nr:hypothetical protein BLD25_03965 [Candidatus Gracilibacteria bacterium GN02-872]